MTELVSGWAVKAGKERERRSLKVPASKDLFGEVRQ